MLILLFLLFFQLPVCLWHLSTGTVLCALIRQPSAAHSLLHSLSLLTAVTDFCFCERGQIFGLPPLTGALICSFIGQIHSPCMAPCFLLQLVPSL